MSAPENATQVPDEAVGRASKWLTDNGYHFRGDSEVRAFLEAYERVRNATAPAYAGQVTDTDLIAELRLRANLEEVELGLRATLREAAETLERQERELIELRAVKQRAEARIDVLQEVIDEEEEYALKPGNARYDISNYERILHGGETKHGE